MKKLFFFPFFLFFLFQMAYGGNGSFLVLKSAYLYEDNFQEGKKIITNDVRAYEVMEIKKVNNELFYKITYPSLTNFSNQTGYVFESEQKLQELGIKDVKVYPQLPSKTENLLNFISVPANQISLTGKIDSTKDFPNVEWRAVNFKTLVPRKFWVIEQSGIYRPEKEAVWLNRVYQEIRRIQIDSTLQEKILMGLVEPGFTKREVRWTLGEPLNERRKEGTSESEWEYFGRRIIFISDVVQHVL